MSAGWTAGASRAGRFLVTGAAGFLGHHVTGALRERGYTVIPVDDLRVAPLLPAPDGLRTRDVQDLTTGDLDGVDGVLHLAALRSVPESARFPHRYQSNIAQSTRLFELVRCCGVRRLLVVSSCEVYGIARDVPTPEDSPIAPRSPYAMSKAAVELNARIATWCGETDLRIARLFNVYGPGNRPDTVIASMCRSALTDGRLRVDAPGTQRRDFSYVDATVARLIRMFELPACPPVVNVGSGTSTSVLELAELVARLCPGVRVDPADGRPGEIPEFRADTTLADSVLGSIDEVPLEHGIERTLAWWRRFLSDDGRA